MNNVVKLGSASDDYFKKYDRRFIQLDHNTVMLIHLFEKDLDHSFEDIWLNDFTKVAEYDYNLYEIAAKQFIVQLEGNYCISFLKALREECDKIIEEDRIRKEKTCKKLGYGTKNENV